MYSTACRHTTITPFELHSSAGVRQRVLCMVALLSFSTACVSYCYRALGNMGRNAPERELNFSLAREGLLEDRFAGNSCICAE